ncbi:MAG TPA: hypothetical protein VJB63_04340 [Patescibacteria group bacterium]|nr:hypothetical protein [Patescibacteria group bacterium]
MKMISARIISFICGPVSWVIFFLISSYYKGLFQNKNNMIIVILIAFIIPIILFIVLLKTKKISDLDISLRQERYPLLIIINICLLALLYFLNIRHLTTLFHLTQIVYIIITVSSLITLFYKISFHITFSYTFAILINALFSFQLWWLYLIIPAVFWSRLTLKKHTVMQMLLALVIDSFIIFALW